MEIEINVNEIDVDEEENDEYENKFVTVIFRPNELEELIYEYNQIKELNNSFIYVVFKEKFSMSMKQYVEIKMDEMKEKKI